MAESIKIRNKIKSGLKIMITLMFVIGMIAVGTPGQFSTVKSPLHDCCVLDIS